MFRYSNKEKYTQNKKKETKMHYNGISIQSNFKGKLHIFIKGDAIVSLIYKLNESRFISGFFL